MAILKRHQYSFTESDKDGKAVIDQPVKREAGRIIKNTFVTSTQQLPSPAPIVTVKPKPAPKPKPVAQSTLPELDPLGHQQALEASFIQEKQQFLQTLESEKESTMQKAYQDGLAKGQKAGEAQYQAKAAEMMQTIASVVSEKNKVLKQSKGEILNLAMKIAEQILKSEISFNQAVCLNIVAEALSRITDKDQVIIRVGSSDFDYVNSHRERLHNQMSDIKSLSVQEDSKIEQGGCIIETRLGFIDSTIATKLDSIRAVIEKVYEEESAGRWI